VGDLPYLASHSDFQHHRLSCAAGATTYVFLAAVALKLARNTPEAIKFRRRYEAKEISKGEYVKGMSLEKNRIANISWVSPIRSSGFAWNNFPKPQVFYNVG
jgi:hypothetical protein